MQRIGLKIDNQSEKDSDSLYPYSKQMSREIFDKMEMSRAGRRVENSRSDMAISIRDIPPQEVLVEKFLSQFVIISESTTDEHLDIVLFMKSLPSRITEKNLTYAQMFDMETFQQALIAY